MTYQESYEKLGAALVSMSDRLRDLLCEAEDEAAQDESWDATPGSWQEDNSMRDTASKLRDLLLTLKQDKLDGLLTIDEDVTTLLRELTELLTVEQRTPSFTVSQRPRSVSLFSHDSPKPVLSARACVVCHRDDRPGEQRRRGFKCLECIGTPSKLERSDVSFGVLEKTGTKSSDIYGKKSIEEYDLGSNVGKGAYGKVKTCRHKKGGQLYAMKIVDRRRLEKIRKPGSTNTEFDKVMTEIEIMKSLHHPNVVKMYEVIDDPESGKVYLIMEFCSKGRIFDIEGEQEGMANTEPERFKKYIVAMANGLDYLHNQHIYHRDLKPDNILLDASDHVKLTDFGVSAVTGENDVLTQTEGTPAFNAPEEFMEEKMAVDGAKADIWSFGVTVYCMAFGYLPFMGSDIRELGEAIRTQPETYPEGTDPQLLDLLRRFLQKDPTKRITLKEVLNHPYVEDVRTVKGQAMETILCRIRTVEAEDIGVSSSDPEFQFVDGLFVRFTPKDPKFAKGTTALADYLQNKGGIYQVVLPTPDSCTLFRPRSARRQTQQADHMREISFSFVEKDPGTHGSGSLLSARNFLSSDNLRYSSHSLEVDRTSNAEADREADSLLDQLGISLL